MPNKNDYENYEETCHKGIIEDLVYEILGKKLEELTDGK